MAWIITYFLIGLIFSMLAYGRLTSEDFDYSEFETQFNKTPDASDIFGCCLIVLLLWPLAILGGLYYALTR